MSAKTSPARRAVFLAALAETGNQTLAAERAKVSRSWVSLHRSSDPAFRRQMDAAVAAASAALSATASVGPEQPWTADGEELTVRSSRGRWRQVGRARVRQWTPRLEARFLARLAATCNVKAACAAVGLSQASAYTHRKRWPRFAEQWSVAMEIGYDRLAGALVASAGAMLGERDWEPEALMPVATFAQAIQLLRLHQAQVRNVGKLPGRRPRPKSLDEVRASILRKLEAIHRVAQAGERDGSGDGFAADVRP
jgi:hypothetical protein